MKSLAPVVIACSQVFGVMAVAAEAAPAIEVYCGDKQWFDARGNPQPRSKKRAMDLGRRYAIRARVETLPGPKTRYSVKGRAADTAEPKNWDLVAIDGEKDVQSGSLLLVAHHSDVTFGDVEVRALR